MKLVDNKGTFSMKELEIIKSALTTRKVVLDNHLDDLVVHGMFDTKAYDQMYDEMERVEWMEKCIDQYLRK